MMLPALPQAFGNLKDVFRSAHDSLNGRPNPFDLPKVKNSLFILVDGLGWENINQFPGHAPFLKRNMPKQAKGFSGFPSTTASSIVSIATGQQPSRHGFIGYRIYDRNKAESVNLLTGLSPETVSEYLKELCFVESSNDLVVVSKPEYQDSGFSYATFPDARFFGASDINKRFEIALQELNTGSGKLIYLYVPELDQTAHKFGCQSDKWIQLLEKLDSEVKNLQALAHKSCGILLTADHGVVDVPSGGHIYLDECADLENQLADVGGDPRASFLYLKDAANRAKVKSVLIDWLGTAAQIFEVSELIDAGLYDKEVLSLGNILPDFVVLAGSKRATYHRDFAKPASLAMVGQHGGLSDAEITIPILRLGAYSSSLLVP
jgi:predicted AlkP superfamily pyrophosphatase or phosphodiesterase